MKSQRSIFTLSALSEGSLPLDSGRVASVSSFNNCLYNEPSLTQFVTSESEPLIPCYLYQYPLLQMSYEQFQSVTSICQPSLAITSFENLNFLPEYPSESGTLVSTSLPSDSGYGDCLLPDVFPSEEFDFDNFQALSQEVTDSCPIVTNYGAVSILLRHLVRVDISPENALYVSIAPADCIAAINGTGDKSCVIHPNGRVFHDGNDIHMSTLNRKAKICKKGVIFTSSDHCLSYLVDESGTKTTAERFRDLSQDFSFQVFYSDAIVEDSIPQCFYMVDHASRKTFDNGDEVWMIGGFRIKQDQWGDVKVTNYNDTRILKASPTNGQVTVKTKLAEISVGRYPNNYLLVRKDSKVVSASLKGFNAQNSTQKAGINSSGKVVLH